METQMVEIERPKRVLVVDDDPFVARFIQESVSRLGYHCDVFTEPEVALEANKKDPYDVVITDMKMPGMDGLTMLKNIRQSPHDTDVIVVTGYGSVANALDSINAGAFDYLIKPFTIEQIQVAMVKVFRHRELKRLANEREMYLEMSYEDPLTGVYNRRFFDEALKIEVIKASRLRNSFALLMIDVDNFKEFNDLYGHLKGDEVLSSIGRVFKSVCRGYDIITRYGGDEFAIIFPETDRGVAVSLCERIMAETSALVFEDESEKNSLRVSISIGVAIFPDNASNINDLIRCADEALYAAKCAGRNSFRIYGA
ncbi:MAG: diguanylate cyclase [Syntrophaceae bacterium]|nr:diguanylate cyclase [Syntrophaceae bacterium]